VTCSVTLPLVMAGILLLLAGLLAWNALILLEQNKRLDEAEARHEEAILLIRRVLLHQGQDSWLPRPDTGPPPVR
jgi:hypothetical protein